MLETGTDADVVLGLRLRGSPVRSDAPFEVIDIEPATGQVLARVVGGGPLDARAAVDSAAERLQDWSSTPPPRRASALRAIAAELRRADVEEHLSRAITQEVGKRIEESRAEIRLSAGFFDWFAEAIGTSSGRVWNVVPGVQHEVERQALGVVAAITAWNFPVSIPARKISAALAAGCTVVFKPSDIAPLSALRLAQVIEQHVPPGALNTVIGPSRAVANEWLSDRRVRGLTFTGSTAVGQALARASVTNLTRCILELGGNAPFIVLDDANLDRSVDIMLAAKLRNNGQSCIAANQVWVPRDQIDRFLAAIMVALNATVVGDPLDPETELGPLALPSDPPRMEALLTDAEASGARVVRVERPLPAAGQFSSPAICVDAPPEARVSKEEIFGPILSLRGYRHLKDVLKAVHGDAHGLGGYICGSDLARATAVARDLDVGIVGINTATPNTPQVAFAGRKLSGIGSEGGYGGLEEFTVYQTLARTTHQ